MLKKIQGLAVLAALLTVSGCATTGRNYQTDIDALNARITALQGQLAEKDQQIADQRMAREAAEAALRDADNQKRRMAEKEQAKAPASSLK